MITFDKLEYDLTRFFIIW